MTATPSGPAPRTSQVPLAEQKPLAAAVLVAMGGFLIVLEGLLFGEIVLVVAGLFLFVMALLVRHEPHHHVANGITVLLLVFLSFIFGAGGFFFGGLLAGIGGVLAIVWTARAPSGPVRVRT